MKDGRHLNSWHPKKDRSRQTPPETTNQPDALDEPVANHLPQALAAYHRRRVRQVRRVDLEFLSRGSIPLPTTISHRVALRFLMLRLKR